MSFLLIRRKEIRNSGRKAQRLVSSTVMRSKPSCCDIMQIAKSAALSKEKEQKSIGVVEYEQWKEGVYSSRALQHDM